MEKNHEAVLRDIRDRHQHEIDRLERRSKNED